LFLFGAVTVSSHFFQPHAKVNSSVADVQPYEVIRMSNPVQAIQPVNAQAQTQQTALPPKNQPTATHAAGPQDKVTISPQSHQALANNAKPAAGANVDHDGDNH
jgi:hypothetical protein